MDRKVRVKTRGTANKGGCLVGAKKRKPKGGCKIGRKAAGKDEVKPTKRKIKFNIVKKAPQKKRVKKVGKSGETNLYSGITLPHIKKNAVA